MLLLTLLLCLLSTCVAHKFLFYETAFGRSHVQFAGKLVDVLVENGHTVDILMLAYNPDLTTNGTIKARRVHKIHPRDGAESFWMKMAHFKSPFEPNKQIESKDYFDKTLEQFCDALINDDALMETLKNENYDAGLTMIYETCPFGLFHVLNIKPVMGFMATAMPNMISRAFHLPSPPSYVLSESILCFKSNFGVFLDLLRNTGVNYRTMTFFDRLNHYIYQLQDYFFDIPKSSQVVTNVFRRKYGHGFPHLDALMAEMSMVFINSEKVTDATRPISHKIKCIGGIQSHEAKPLTKEFLDIYNRSHYGVILFSFGSLLKTSIVPMSIKLQFLKAFSRFPQYTFIWKYDDLEEEGEIFKNHTNVYPTKWMPQYDLLCHKLTIAFITHLGQNSFLEVSNAGTPIVAVPLFADQLFNSAVALEKGLGVRIDRLNLTETSIYEALNEVILNPTYRNNARKISKMLRTQPFSARDIFVKNVEYLVENPEVGEHFQLPSVHMPFWQEHSLDVVGFLALSAVFVISTSLYVTWRLYTHWLVSSVKRKKCD